MLDDEGSEHGGGDDDDVPWSREQFEPGNRVRYTAKAIRHHIPTKSRRAIRGTVVKAEIGDSTPYTYSVTVLWDGYKRAHRYAACFVTKT